VRVRPAYRLLDHTADLAFEVEAPDWPGLLDRATAALGDVILSDRGEEAPETRAVRVAGEDREDVLVAWLTEVVVRFEEERFLARGARLDLASVRAAEGVLLGRVVDLAAEAPDRVVKAVTYHDLRVLGGDPGERWRAAVVLDL
jgi:SHS2 domain-containing protein